MPSTSLSETARSTDFRDSLAESAAVFCSWILEEKAARGTVETASVRGTVAKRRQAASVRKDMVGSGGERRWKDCWRLYCTTEVLVVCRMMEKIQLDFDFAH